MILPVGVIAGRVGAYMLRRLAEMLAGGEGESQLMSINRALPVFSRVDVS
jgi:hypothetical protein